MSAANGPHDTDRDALERHDLGGCRWWHGPEPSADTFAALGRQVEPPSAVLEAMHAIPARPHLTRCEGWRIWTLTPVTFRPATAQAVVGHLVVATDDVVVVTVGGLPGLAAEEFVARVRERLDPPPDDAQALVLGIFGEVLDAAARAVSELDDAVEDIEEVVFAPQRGSHAERIYRLKREVQRVRRCVGPFPELVSTSTAAASSVGVDTDLGVGSPGLLARARRVVEQVAHADDLLDSVLAAHHTQVTIQQNDDMRRISA
jgi:magnesium transporter